jgi:hypothetical protein
LRDKLRAQREQAKGTEAHRVLTLKIAMLTELLEGPMPAAEPKPAKAPAVAVAHKKEATPAELLEGARYLISVGKQSLLTNLQKEALKAAGE